MQRRHFLHAASAASALAFSGRLLAAPAAGSRLLVVFLRGGYDAASLLVPLSSSFYREVRPNIAIPAAGDGANGAWSLDADWGVHPALRASIEPLVHKRQVAFVPFAGTHNLSRSHFETQDAIELGQGAAGADAQRDFGSGFLNRLAATLQGRDAIAFTDQLPLVLRGEASVANVSLRNLPRAADARLRAALTGMYHDHPLGSRVTESFAVRDQVAQQVAMEAARERPQVMPNAATDERRQSGIGELASANRNAVSAKGFELEARRMARLMRERFALGFVDIGGWDTHVGQGGATGYLASRLEELGRGLAGFADEIGDAAWRDTVVVVVSEFGRTVRENGNRGTDHGHGSVYWVMGGSLAAGPVVGEQQVITAQTLFQNRDLPVLNDYRALLGGLFSRQFGLSPAQVDRVFPGVTARDLRLL